MATPGTMTYPRRRHNITIGDNVWRAIQVRAAELGIPAGEVVDRAFALVSDLEDRILRHPGDHESSTVLLLRAELVKDEARA